MEEEIRINKESLILQLKETATGSYQRFINAFELLKNHDPKAEKEFEIIVNNAYFVLKSMDFYLGEYINEDVSEELLYIGQIVSLETKAYHNMALINHNNSNLEREETYSTLEMLNRAHVSYYYHLSYMMKTNPKTKEILFTFLKDANLNNKETALADLFLLNFVIKHKCPYLYFSYQLNNEYKHWFSAYHELNEALSTFCFDMVNRIGYFLVTNFHDINIKKLIYHSVFYESLCLTYMYQNHIDDPHEIIMSGYDHYLEIETLQIVYQYDHDYFVSLIPELKVVCLERLIEKSNPDSLFRLTYGNEYSDELNKLCKDSLALIDRNDSNDYRNQSDRNTPNWA